MRGIEIRMIDELPEFVKDNHVEIATLTLPKAKALDMAKLLVDVGVKAIWNFAHTDLNLFMPEDVIVENVHLSESLMRLSYTQGPFLKKIINRNKAKFNNSKAAANRGQQPFIC